MPQFDYRAVNGEGKTVRGRQDAANLTDLEARLRQVDLELIDGRPVTSLGMLAKRRLPRREVITFCLLMEQMTNAGVPLLEGLEDLRDGTDNARMRDAIASMIENIRSGQLLSESMQTLGNAFDEVTVQMVRIGERSGTLPAVFKELAATLKWQDELISETKRLLSYPAFVFVVITAVFMFLMLYLVPQLSGFLANMGGEMPFHTKVLFWLSAFLINYWWVLLIVVAVLVVSVLVFSRSSTYARDAWDAFVLRIPTIGPILRKIALARFSNLMAMMYSAGLTVLVSLAVCERAVGNRTIARAIGQVHNKIEEGATITQAFEQADVFPRLVMRMIRTGESTGRLDESMRNVNYFYTREVKESIERVQTLIEPTLTLIMGLLLGWLMLSTLGPIYDTISRLKI